MTGNKGFFYPSQKAAGVSLYLSSNASGEKPKFGTYWRYKIHIRVLWPH